MEPITLVGSLVAIVLLAGLARLVYGAPAPITDKAVRRAFWRAYPDVKVDMVTLDTAARHALLITGQGPALVEAMGDKLVCRLLTDGADIRRDGNTIRVGTHDFTAPRFTYKTSTAEDAERIIALMTGAPGQNAQPQGELS